MRYKVKSLLAHDTYTVIVDCEEERKIGEVYEVGNIFFEVLEIITKKRWKQ